jgi:hypothetical protein
MATLRLVGIVATFGLVGILATFELVGNGDIWPHLG